MLECSLHALDIVRGFAYINWLVLGVLNTQSESATVIPAFPTSRVFRKVPVPYADSHILVVKESSVKLEKVDQVFSQVYFSMLSKPFILPL